MGTELQSSIYSTTPDMTVTRIIPDEHDLKKEWSGKNIPGMEPIERALFKFGFLTADLLERYLTTKNCKRLDIRKSLNNLYQDGEVHRYTIEGKEDSNRALDIYLLSRKAEDKVRKNSRPRASFRYDMTDVPYIMQNLATAQWHIALLEKSGSKEIMYNGRADSGRAATPVVIPSMIRCKIKEKYSMVFCGIPAPKGVKKRTLGAFLTNFIQLSEYMMKRHDLYPRYSIVVLCESSTQMNETASFLKNIKEASGHFALYALDMNSIKGSDPLSILYDVTINDDSADYSLINLTKNVKAP